MPRPSAAAIRDASGEVIAQRCSDCRGEKPLDQFHQDRHNKTTGRQRRCKICSRRRCASFRAQRTLLRITVPLAVAEWLATLARIEATTPAVIAQEILIDAAGAAAAPPLALSHHNDAPPPLALAADPPAEPARIAPGEVRRVLLECQRRAGSG